MSTEMLNILINICYLMASICFILGLKGLSHAKSAVKGNFISSFGMLIAIVATLLYKEVVTFELIIFGIIIGSVIGTFLAFKIKMTSMPELVAISNGLGGLSSVLVASTALIEVISKNNQVDNIQLTISITLSGLIGSITFWGSFIAFGKLYGLKIIKKNPIRYKGEQLIKLLILSLALIVGFLIVDSPKNSFILFWILVILGSILGILLVISIGGADMPVVIALLNSYSGLAAAATGFILSNNVLIIAGSMVGASGIILTKLMCKAMNRSLTNVLFGAIGIKNEKTVTNKMYENKIKSISAEDVAMFLNISNKIVIVPGYGMAVGQAQHAVKNLVQFLEEKKGIEVNFAIHPVAGRMPGHMNVLLAEVDISYEKMKDIDEINENLAQTDLAIILGANDVVNPDSRRPESPIAGMPIINVDKVKNVVIIKRTLNPGFAGIPNPLFTNDNSYMFFEDGKKAILSIINAIKTF